MRAHELIERLNADIKERVTTCDTIKAGNAEKELSKVAVSMFATVDIVRRAREWGADMLIVHEPTYYDHMEVVKNETPVIKAKRAFIEDSGMVIYRYHDHMHDNDTDGITEGELHYLGLSGKIEKTNWFASYILTLDTPISALELAKRMESELKIAHVRIAGERDKKAARVGACFGTPGGVFELLCREDIDMVLTGEACEWKLCEYARDAAALGINKSLIVMGHIGSERDGMRLLAERMKKNYTEFETEYFECGEVYSYTDSGKSN